MKVKFQSNINAVLFLIIISCNLISAQTKTYHYLPVANKTLGIWPDTDTWMNNKFAVLHDKWGFSKVLIVSSSPGVDYSFMYNNALAAGFNMDNLLLVIWRSNYQYAIDNFPSKYYYIGEAVEHDCAGQPTVGDKLYSATELSTISQYIKSKRPASKLVIDGYKRCSHLIIAGGIADKILYSSYVNWNSTGLPVCHVNIGWGDNWESPWLEGAGNQSDSWRDMKQKFGSKFSWSWMHANGDDYYDLFRTANELGLETIWLYSYDLVDPAKLEIFCNAAANAGWLQKVEDANVQAVDISITYPSSPAPLKLGESITTSGTISGSGSGIVNYKWQWKKPGAVNFEDITGVIEAVTMTNGTADILSVISNPFTEIGSYTFRIITTIPNTITSNEQQVIVELNKPDLRISYISLNKQEVFAGDQVTISYRVENIGLGKAEASRVGFSYNPTPYAPDYFLDFADESIIQPGATTATRTKVITIPDDWETGIYYMIAFADYQNVLAESNEGNNRSSTQINFLQSCDISGAVLYDGIPEFGLANCNIRIKNNENLITYTKTSDANGNFTFTNIPYGEYSISFQSNLALSSVNAADALQVVKYYVGMTELDEFQLIAANVNNNKVVNSGDALLILQRYLGIITVFPNNKPDWLFNYPTSHFIVNQPQKNLTIKCIESGDVNKSFKIENEVIDDDI